jgi:hypothetical protein
MALMLHTPSHIRILGVNTHPATFPDIARSDTAHTQPHSYSTHPATFVYCTHPATFLSHTHDDIMMRLSHGAFITYIALFHTREIARFRLNDPLKSPYIILVCEIAPFRPCYNPLTTSDGFDHFYLNLQRWAVLTVFTAT